jgi:HEAT repeats
MATRIVTFICLLTCCSFASTDSDELSLLLIRFQSERDIARKEAIILEVSQKYRDAGPQLLQIAESTSDLDTEWLAIRGIGYVKYQPAAPFLVTSLASPYHYVRANAARALGEIKAYSAATHLISLLKSEQDNGVIEQTTLALEMIRARESIAVLRARAENVSNPQTECWLIDGIAMLGSGKEASFIAERLYNDEQVIALCAATGLQQITGEDLHLGIHQGLFSPSEAISTAKGWWERNASNWR